MVFLANQMQKGGVVPTATTFVNLLNPHARVGCVEWVREVHNHALKARVASEIHIGNSLIHMYANSGSIEDAQRVFDKMEDRDVITWNVMMDGLAQHGLGHEVLQLFEQMIRQDVKLDGFTHVVVLSACSHTSLVKEGCCHFMAMTFPPSVMHYNCMVDLLGRAGHLEEAKLFIANMPVESNAMTWKALLGACKTHSDVKLAEFVAREVLRREPEDWSGCLTRRKREIASIGS